MRYPFFYAPLKSSLTVEAGYGKDYAQDYYCRVPKTLEYRRDTNIPCLAMHYGCEYLRPHEPLYHDNGIVLHSDYKNKFQYRTILTGGPKANQEVDGVTGYALNKTTDPNKPLHTSIGRDVEKYTVMTRDEYKTAPRNSGTIFDYMHLDPNEDVHLDIFQDKDQFADGKVSGPMNFSFYFKAEVNDTRYLFIHMPVDFGASGSPAIDFITVTLKVENNKVSYVRDGDSSLTTDTGELLSTNSYLPESAITLQILGDFTRVGIQFTAKYEHFRCLIRFSDKLEQSFNGFIPETPPDAYYFWGWQFTTTATIMPYLEAGSKVGATTLKVPYANMPKPDEAFKISFDVYTAQLQDNEEIRLVCIDENPTTLYNQFYISRNGKDLIFKYNDYYDALDPRNAGRDYETFYNEQKIIVANVPTGKHHLELVYYPTTKNLKCYVNGDLKNVVKSYGKKSANYTNMFLGDFRELPTVTTDSPKCAIEISEFKIFHASGMTADENDFIWLPLRCEDMYTPIPIDPHLHAPLKSTLLVNSGFIDDYRSMDQYIKPQYVVFRRDSEATCMNYSHNFSIVEKDVPDLSPQGLLIHTKVNNELTLDSSDLEDPNVFSITGFKSLGVANFIKDGSLEFKIHHDSHVITLAENRDSEGSRIARSVTLTAKGVNYPESNTCFNFSFYIRTNIKQKRYLYVSTTSPEGFGFSKFLLEDGAVRFIKQGSETTGADITLTRDNLFNRVCIQLCESAINSKFRLKFHDENDQEYYEGVNNGEIALWGFQITKSFTPLPFTPSSVNTSPATLLVPIERNLHLNISWAMSFTLKSNMLPKGKEHNIFSMLSVGQTYNSEGDANNDVVTVSVDTSNTVQDVRLVGNRLIKNTKLDTEYKIQRHITLVRTHDKIKFIYGSADLSPEDYPVYTSQTILPVETKIEIRQTHNKFTNTYNLIVFVDGTAEAFDKDVEVRPPTSDIYKILAFGDFKPDENASFVISDLKMYTE